MPDGAQVTRFSKLRRPAAASARWRSFRPSSLTSFCSMSSFPTFPGLDVCTTIANTSDACIFMVSAHASESDVLKGLRLGADDYAKPLSFSELISRVQSFLRRRERSRSSAADTSRLSIGNATLARDRQMLSQGRNEASLTALEFRLLWFLWDAEGRLMTRAEILEKFGTIFPECRLTWSTCISLRCARSLRRSLPTCRYAACAGSGIGSIMSRRRGRRPNATTRSNPAALA
jgi:CheY-like chemotaxis protein